MYFVLLFFVIFTSPVCFGAPILAQSVADYYGDIQGPNQELRVQLHDVLNLYHISQEQGPDLKVDNCDSRDPHCYRHRSLSYREARQFLFGDLFLKGNSEDTYQITSTYCETLFDNTDFPNGKGLGPMKIPSHTVINTEHVWPQSRFTGRFPKSLQKGDLHHLLPVINRVNSQRGNMPFGEVDESTTSVCGAARLGKDENGQTTQFEPSPEYKGNVARSIFYFALRYNMKIDDLQESYLRAWNQMDPVDFEEIQRHERIFEIEYVRNPFVDKPSLVDEIEDF